MQSDLKMCPFCGGDGEYHSDKGPTGEVYAWVGCNQCDAMSVHCDVRSMQPEETHPIDAWNNRASDAEITRLTEALRKAEEREKALREALEPFVAARLLIGGEIIGLERWHFDRAHAALKDQPHD